MTQTIMKCDFCENFIDPKQLSRHVLCKVVQHEDGSVALQEEKRAKIRSEQVKKHYAELIEKMCRRGEIAK